MPLQMPSSTPMRTSCSRLPPPGQDRGCVLPHLTGFWEDHRPGGCVYIGLPGADQRPVLRLRTLCRGQHTVWHWAWRRLQSHMRKDARKHPSQDPGASRRSRSSPCCCTGTDAIPRILVTCALMIEVHFWRPWKPDAMFEAPSRGLVAGGCLPCNWPLPPPSAHPRGTKRISPQAQGMCVISKLRPSRALCLR